MARKVRRPVVFVGAALKDLKELPREVQRKVGHALHEVQLGDRPSGARILHGFGGGKVLEIAADFDGDTYRAVYTVRFATAVYVLHCFQKKSKRGSETPKPDLDLIRQRLRDAQEMHDGRSR